MAEIVAETAFDVCELWLARCQEALEDCGSAPLSAAYVAAGSVPWDTCCGVLVVAPERIYRTDLFPAEQTVEEFCDGAVLAVDLVVLLLRCVSTVDDRGKAPTPATMSEEFSGVLTDAAVIWNAVTGELPPGWERGNVEQAFIGAEGGCIGVETRFTVGLAQGAWCPCPDPEDDA